MENKSLYYKLESSDGEGGIMDLTGCVEWIKGDLESNYSNSINMPEEDQPQYALTPVWMTEEEYEKLPDQ